MLEALVVIKGIVLAALAFGLMVFVHELGHFLAAKLMGVRVEKFSFGMGPRLIGHKWGDTDYMISAVPIGGYVRMAGGDEGEDSKGAPDEFVSKTPGQRAFIIVAGPVFSVLFGIPLMMAVYVIGLEVPLAQVSDVVIGSPAWDAGVKHGDRVTRLDNTPVEAFDQLQITAISSEADKALAMTVERDGKPAPLTIRRPKGEALGLSCMFLTPTVAKVMPGSAAAKAGVQVGDVIQSVDGKPLRGWGDFRRHVLGKAGAEVTLGIERDGKPITLKATPGAREGKDPGFSVRLPREIGFVRGGFPADGELEVGDEIVQVNGTGVAGWWDIEDAVANGPPTVTLTVEKDEKTRTVTLERGGGMRLTDTLGIAPRTVYIVGHVHGATSPQVVPGDVIVKIGPADLSLAWPTGSLYEPLPEIGKIMAQHGQVTIRRPAKPGLAAVAAATGQTLSPLAAWCAGVLAAPDDIPVGLSPSEGQLGQLGIEATRHMVLRKKTFMASVGPALRETGEAAQLVYTVLRKLLSRDVRTDAVAGPLGILQLTYSQATRGLPYLFRLVGMITVNIGVLNLLPVPPLDGGRLVFLAYEKIRG